MNTPSSPISITLRSSSPTHSASPEAAVPRRRSPRFRSYASMTPPPSPSLVASSSPWSDVLPSEPVQPAVSWVPQLGSPLVGRQLRTLKVAQGGTARFVVDLETRKTFWAVLDPSRSPTLEAKRPSIAALPSPPSPKRALPLDAEPVAQSKRSRHE